VEKRPGRNRNEEVTVKLAGDSGELEGHKRGQLVEKKRGARGLSGAWELEKGTGGEGGLEEVGELVGG